MRDSLFQLEQEIQRRKQQAQAGFSAAASFEAEDELQNNRLLALQQSLMEYQAGNGLELGLGRGMAANHRTSMAMGFIELGRIKVDDDPDWYVIGGMNSGIMVEHNFCWKINHLISKYGLQPLAHPITATVSGQYVWILTANNSPIPYRLEYQNSTIFLGFILSVDEAAFSSSQPQSGSSYPLMPPSPDLPQISFTDRPLPLPQIPLPQVPSGSPQPSSLSPKKLIVGGRSGMVASPPSSQTQPGSISTSQPQTPQKTLQRKQRGVLKVGTPSIPSPTSGPISTSQPQPSSGTATRSIRLNKEWLQNKQWLDSQLIWQRWDSVQDYNAHTSETGALLITSKDGLKFAIKAFPQGTFGTVWESKLLSEHFGIEVPICTCITATNVKKWFVNSPIMSMDYSAIDALPYQTDEQTQDKLKKGGLFTLFHTKWKKFNWVMGKEPEFLVMEFMDVFSLNMLDTALPSSSQRQKFLADRIIWQEMGRHSGVNVVFGDMDHEYQLSPQNCFVSEDWEEDNPARRKYQSKVIGLDLTPLLISFEPAWELDQFGWALKLAVEKGKLEKSNEFKMAQALCQICQVEPENPLRLFDFVKHIGITPEDWIRIVLGEKVSKGRDCMLLYTKEIQGIGVLGLETICGTGIDETRQKIKSFMWNDFVKDLGQQVPSLNNDITTIYGLNLDNVISQDISTCYADAMINVFKWFVSLTDGQLKNSYQKAYWNYTKTFQIPPKFLPPLCDLTSLQIRRDYLKFRIFGEKDHKMDHETALNFLATTYKYDVLQMIQMMQKFRED